ncbi:MAG: imidazole glycerol phosphate synthase subunit HisH [Actinomycetota bacterium]|nr:imidazole glycerol phosphate synthase subunit HisH [Actinomycetota bacterium]
MPLSKLALIDYGIGNLRSVAKALSHVGADIDVIEEPVVLDHYTGVVLPGVGHFGACVSALRDSGFDDLIFQCIDGGIPLLGVCVGLQMLFEGSEESPDTGGLGILPGRVLRFNEGERVPQMQWNTISIVDAFVESPLLSGITNSKWMYFVHSYYAPVGDYTSAIATYGVDYSASIEREALFATQFHPEKSSKEGLKILDNFVSIATIER